VSVFAELQSWTSRRWTTAAIAAVIVTLVIGLPTDIVPNPVFGRAVGITWWSYPVLAVTALLGGLLAATYVRETRPELVADDKPARRGGIGGLLSFFAVGCPVCNKLVIIALGSVGARRWFEPIQPYLAVVSVALLAMSLRSRLRNANACPLPSRA
jgi:hypothetical protein